MSDLLIRSVSADEFAVALAWAAAEGWNPGLDDMRAFHAADPEGFLMGLMDGQPVSSISVVRYGDSFGFLGFYIVQPAWRGHGYGMATWQAGLHHLGARTIGLDGVVDQQDNYKKSGFVYAGRNVRYSGVPAVDPATPLSPDIRTMQAADLTALEAYERNLFPARRRAFLEAWTVPGPDEKRVTKIAVTDGRVRGYGTIRACRAGHKIGPLFAADEKTATSLFIALCRTTSGSDEISLDPPDANGPAVALARRFGLHPVFETARMYKGEAPVLALDHIYGLTTFELG
ncbi:MAG: GNAT family N-acetyltransferase [Rhodospirillales bacterium]|nr:GNAT family N-acetyltransferase [Rhodospirillales bacterium]